MKTVLRLSFSILPALLILMVILATATIAAQQSNPEKEQIRIGYAPNSFVGADKNDVHVALNIWTKELVKNTSIKGDPVTIIFDNIQEVVEAVRQQKVDYVVMSVLDYLGIRQSVNLEPVLVGTRNGQACEEYALIVHRSAPWTDVKQLQDKKLLVQTTAGASFISLLWLDNLLIQQGLPGSAKFFQSLKMVDKPSQAVFPVFFKQADVCLVPRWAYDTMVELNPQVGSETKILALSPSLSRGALFMRKGINGGKQTLIDSALELGNSAKSKQLMALFNYEKLIRFSHNTCNLP